MKIGNGRGYFCLVFGVGILKCFMFICVLCRILGVGIVLKKFYFLINFLIGFKFVFVRLKLKIRGL